MENFIEGFGAVIAFYSMGIGISAVLNVLRAGGNISE